MLAWGCLGPLPRGRREHGVAHELRSAHPAEAARAPSVRAISRGRGRAAYHKSSAARLGFGLELGPGLVRGSVRVRVRVSSPMTKLGREGGGGAARPRRSVAVQAAVQAAAGAAAAVAAWAAVRALSWAGGCRVPSCCCRMTSTSLSCTAETI